jgi:hypothetical protein
VGSTPTRGTSHEKALEQTGLSPKPLVIAIRLLTRRGIFITLVLFVTSFTIDLIQGLYAIYYLMGINFLCYSGVRSKNNRRVGDV